MTRKSDEQTPMIWQPTLTGTLAARAQHTLAELLDALGGVAGSHEPTLDGGAGRALLWAYAHSAFPNNGYDARREAALDDVVERLASTVSHPSLLSGFVGAAWVVNHLAGADDDDPVGAIDDALAELLATPRWQGEFDLLYGLTGIGVYALARADRPSARVCLERVVEKLDGLAEPRAVGVAGRTRPDLRASEVRERWPSGYFDLGVAHGTPAVVLVLAGAIARDVARPFAARLLHGALTWLWHGRDLDAASKFGFWEGDGQRSPPGRLAWCYGDAGISVTLYSAARAVGDEQMAARALEVARASTTRTLESAGVDSSTLCHGAAGLALLYSRLANATGESQFVTASRYWYEHVLTMLPTEGLIAHNTSFLSGAVGVALALLAGLTAIEPRWDQLLAASLPPLTAVR